MAWSYPLQELQGRMSTTTLEDVQFPCFRLVRANEKRASQHGGAATTAQ